MRWSHDTCKSADNCDFLSFFSLHNTTPLSLPPPPSYSPVFHCRLLQMKNYFRRREETRMSSPTLDNESSDFIFPPQQMQQVSYQGQGSVPTVEWTDEKHSMYLKSIEASFVDQLYDLKQTFGCSARVKTSSDSATASGQFKFRRGGIWQKNSFVREHSQSQRSRLYECHDLKANPWIQHYRSLCKPGSLEVPLVDTEMSDQNFADEEVEGEKENKTRDVKRLKSF